MLHFQDTRVKMLLSISTVFVSAMNEGRGYDVCQKKQRQYRFPSQRGIKHQIYPEFHLSVLNKLFALLYTSAFSTHFWNPHSNIPCQIVLQWSRTLIRHNFKYVCAILMQSSTVALPWILLLRSYFLIFRLIIEVSVGGRVALRFIITRGGSNLIQIWL